MSIGIFGGTFDPPHIAHTASAMWVCDEFSLEKVIFVPAYKQPLKLGLKTSSFEHRAEMVRLAITDEERFELSYIEKNLNELSYTVCLLEAMRNIYKKDDLFFLMGADSLAQIRTWFEWERIWNFALPIVFPREGFDIEAEIIKINKPVLISRAPILSISSTIIRERVRAGKPIKYLVDQRVENYIRANGLYK